MKTNLLKAFLTLVILLAVAGVVPGASAGADEPEAPMAPIANAGWEEIGPGSASGGGISGKGTSTNKRDSEEPSIAIGPDGRPVVAWIDYAGPPDEAVNQVYVKRWDVPALAEIPSTPAGTEPPDVVQRVVC